MFYFVVEADICNYADDTTIYTCDVTVDLVIDKPEKHSFETATWFSKNFMKLNGEKCHVMYGEKSNDHSVNIGPVLIKESTEEKLNGVTLEKRLSFETHTQQLCIETSPKLHALARISLFMDSQKLVTVMNAFITSQLATALSCGCFIVAKLITRLTKFMKELLGLHIKIVCQSWNNY